MVNDDPIGLQENSEENLFQTGLEFVDVRLMLEPEVAAMAATNADYADCQKLQQIQKEVEDLVVQGKDHIAADIEYHRQLAACTHNQTLCNLMEIVVKGIPIFVQMTKIILPKQQWTSTRRSQMPFHLQMPREQDMQ